MIDVAVATPNEGVVKDILVAASPEGSVVDLEGKPAALVANIALFTAGI